MSHATVREASTKTLGAELRRRAIEENDKDAARILRPSKTVKANARQS